MLSSKYLLKVRRILEKYRNEEYEEVNFGSCNVCCRAGGRVLSFDLTEYRESDLEEKRIGFAHKRCLERLLGPENFEKFIFSTLEKIRKANFKIQERNN